MTREQIKNYMELFKAYSEGKEIEVIVPCEKGWRWAPAEELHLNDLGSYRIKPKPQRRPYANAEEFLKAQKEHGPYISIFSQHHLATSVKDSKIRIKGSWVDYAILADTRFHKWQDGTPCSVLENN